MRKIISFMHVSLDGFVAGPQGEMDWIRVNPEIFDYVGKRISQSNTAMYGRVTYEMMEAYWPTAGDLPQASKHDKAHAAWYKQAHKIVLSNTLNAAGLNKTRIINGSLADQMNEIKQAEAGREEEILLFGSPTATHALLEQNLIDGYWLFLNPVILGRGIPLFKNIQEKTNLKLLSSQVFDCGVIELNYCVERIFI